MHCQARCLGKRKQVYNPPLCSVPPPPCQPPVRVCRAGAGACMRARPPQGGIQGSPPSALPWPGALPSAVRRAGFHCHAPCSLVGGPPHRGPGKGLPNPAGALSLSACRMGPRGRGTSRSAAGVLCCIPGPGFRYPFRTPRTSPATHALPGHGRRIGARGITRRRGRRDSGRGRRRGHGRRAVGRRQAVQVGAQHSHQVVDPGLVRAWVAAAPRTCSHMSCNNSDPCVRRRCRLGCNTRLTGSCAGARSQISRR